MQDSFLFDKMIENQKGEYTMSEPIKKAKKTPESYKPKKPEIVNMMYEAEKSIVQQNGKTSNIPGFEIVKCEPYRFIGKSAYARAFGKSGIVFGGMWENSKGIFAELDKLKEYATDEIHNAALLHWNYYNDEVRQSNMLCFGPTQLLGYTIGRFMKAETPVPADMDYIDIPEMYVAKGWAQGENEDNAERVVREGIEQQDLYKAASWIYMAEVYPKTDDNDVSVFGYYIACQLKTPSQT